MAHFAELESKTDPTGFTSDTHLVVKRVVVVGNDVVPSDEHADGETWCRDFFGSETIWKQTSYNNNFRKLYAGIGMIYNDSKNKFLMSQPFASWVLDSNDDWEAPVTWPNGDQSEYIIDWDEDNLRWVGTKDSENPNYRWDADNSKWISI
jgi:hypothetical protein